MLATNTEDTSDNVPGCHIEAFLERIRTMRYSEAMLYGQRTLS
jgi:hypothetical protein